jgi:hypothetical protein
MLWQGAKWRILKNFNVQNEECHNYDCKQLKPTPSSSCKQLKPTPSLSCKIACLLKACCVQVFCGKRKTAKFQNYLKLFTKYTRNHVCGCWLDIMSTNVHKTLCPLMSTRF